MLALSRLAPPPTGAKQPDRSNFQSLATNLTAKVNMPTRLTKTRKHRGRTLNHIALHESDAIADLASLFGAELMQTC